MTTPYELACSVAEGLVDPEEWPALALALAPPPPVERCHCGDGRIVTWGHRRDCRGQR